MSGLLILAIIRWARRQEPDRHNPDCGPVEKNVLNSIATYADENARCFPGQDELAAATRYTARAVRLALSRLEALGYLKRRPRRRRDGSRTTDEIELLMLEHDDNPPVEPAPERPARRKSSTGTPRQTNRNPTADQPESDSGLVTLEPSKEESTEHSDPNGSAPGPGAGPDSNHDLWDRSLQTLQRLTRRSERDCRAQIGRWRSFSDDSAIIRTIDEAERAKIVEAMSWIQSRLNPKPRSGSRSSAPAATPASSAAVAERQVNALAMAVRGEWPIGGTVFVASESAQGRAWEAYYRGFGVKPRWRDCGTTGFGWYLPCALPPDRPAAAAA